MNGLGCVQTLIDLRMPSSVDPTGASLTGGGVSTKGGSTLSLLGGEKSRSLLCWAFSSDRV